MSSSSGSRPARYRSKMTDKSSTGIEEPESNPTTRLCCCTSSLMGSSNVSPTAPSPTTTVPRGRSIRTDAARLCGLPMPSMTHAVPSRVISATAISGSPNLASRVCRAEATRECELVRIDGDDDERVWARELHPRGGSQSDTPAPMMTSGSPRQSSIRLRTAPTPVITGLDPRSWVKARSYDLLHPAHALRLRDRAQQIVGTAARHASNAGQSGTPPLPRSGPAAPRCQAWIVSRSADFGG